MPVFRTFRQVRRSTSSKGKKYRLNYFSAESYQNCFFDQTLCYESLLLTTHRNIDELRQHDTGRNASFSDFSPGSANDVVETKRDEGDIVLAQKNIKTAF